jgi:hypothetical protein
MKREDMENKNSSANQQERSIVDRILRPTPNDENVVRIFFWVSVIACLLLPRVFEVLAYNQVWTVISIGWVAFAFYLRIKMYMKR